MLDLSDFGFTEAELRVLAQNIDQLDPDEAAEVEGMLAQIEELKGREDAAADLIAFCQYMDPNYLVGKHHRILADQLMALESGAKDRACVNMPPRHGKSQLVSIYFPAWFIGRNPGKKVMMVSHTTDLAVDFGRKVRNLLDDARYQEVFPDVTLSADSKSAGRWSTNKGSEYYATGVGSSLAGRGADMLIIDDPHSEQDVLNGNFEIFDKAYQWFTFGARTRLMPGGRVAVVQCMTGDTPVLRPDGTETPLRDLRPGDEVASFENGALFAQRVLNHKSNGVDRIFTITTTLGKTVRANARHPFLVVRDGEPKWVRLSALKTGDTVVSLKAVADRHVQQQSGVSAQRVNPLTATTESAPTPPDFRSGTTGSGSEKSVQSTGVANRRRRVAFAPDIMESGAGPTEKAAEAPKRTAEPTSSIATVSPSKSIKSFLRSRAASVLSVVSRLVQKTRGLTGTTNSAWTIVTTPSECERFFATTATLRSGTQKPKESLWRLQNTYELTLDVIAEIADAGHEEVFDIQVEHTENFIANGLVSHNTRWHLDDLTGRLVRDMAQNEGSDQYDVVEFPAILEIPDGDGVIREKPLWPEFFNLEALHRTRASMPVFQWNAQYQQDPTAESAALVKRDWWRIWKESDPPEVDYIIMSLDTATEEKERADFTALTVWGVFFNEAERANHLILLDSIQRRVEFPELKTLAVEQYRHWKPDAFIVEKKNSGVALFQELRRTGMLLQEYMPTRASGNKYARLQSVADIVAAGVVWVPQTRWAEELVEEIAAFPVGSHDDLVDSTVIALMRFREGGYLRLPSDDTEDDHHESYIPYRAAYY